MVVRNGLPYSSVFLILAFEISGLFCPARAATSIEDECRQNAKHAVVLLSPTLASRLEDISYQIDFDCRESGLIDSLSEPVISATKIENQIVESFGVLLSVPIFRNILSVLKPYCRADDAYENFCMATDVESASMASANSHMLNQLPGILVHAASSIEHKKKSNLVDVVQTVYKGLKAEAILLAGFIGLDDNGVQFDRLRSNLLWSRRYEDYAKIFMVSARYAYLGDLRLTENLDKIFYATRTGNLTLPGVEEEATKTYKAYAGLYLGCRLAEKQESAPFLPGAVFAVGASYELLKIRYDLVKTRDEFSEAFYEHTQDARHTAQKMTAGAVYGFELCSQSQ